MCDQTDSPCTTLVTWGSTWKLMLINQLTLTLYWKRNASWWYSSTLLEKCWLMFLILFENLIDNFKNILIRQFEDFLVDKEIQFQNTPNFRSDGFRFSLDIYSPLQFNATFRCTEACCWISQCVKTSHKAWGHERLNNLLIEFNFLNVKTM